MAVSEKRLKAIEEALGGVEPGQKVVVTMLKDESFEDAIAHAVEKGFDPLKNEPIFIRTWRTIPIQPYDTSKELPEPIKRSVAEEIIAEKGPMIENCIQAPYQK
jgi:hypothetical protein